MPRHRYSECRQRALGCRDVPLSTQRRLGEHAKALLEDEDEEDQEAIRDYFNELLEDVHLGDALFDDEEYDPLRFDELSQADKKLFINALDE